MNVPLKIIYDCICTPELDNGSMGCGKNGGKLQNTVHGFIKNGFSAFVICTADGQVLKDVEDSMPEDMPDHKIIHIDFDNKHWPIAANWADVASRNLACAEDELEAIEVAERLTTRLIDYINSNATGELTDRMLQYITSAARAVFSDPSKSLLYVELCLRSPSYRQEILDNTRLNDMPEVKKDLEYLQKKLWREAMVPLLILYLAD